MEAVDKEMDLLSLLRTSHSDAFRTLYKEYYKMVEHFIAKNSGSVADAEDIFQEAMIVVFNKSRSGDFSLSCSLKTFVYSIARNLWLKKLRDRRVSKPITDYEEYTVVDSDEAAEQDSLTQKIAEAVGLLGENCRKILLMFYYEKKNMEEIALSLGYTNAGNAKNQKYKCLQQLKTKFTGADA